MSAAAVAILTVVPGARAQVSPDFDGSGTVGPADLSVYVNEWNTEVSSVLRDADVDEDGAISPADVSRFVELWFSAVSTGYQPPAGPVPPSSPRVINLGDNLQARVLWKDNSANEIRFEVVRQVRVNLQGQPAYAKTRVFMAAANSTSLDDSPGPGSFRYRVRAVGAAGTSLGTAWVYLTIAPPGPPSPALFEWSNLNPQAGSKTWYVSSSLGDDGNLGTEERPLRTISAGMARVRLNYPDRLLLRRGDTWTESVTLRAQGGSASAPMILSSYGTGPRPIIRGGLVRSSEYESKGNLLISGIELAAPVPGQGHGIEWEGGPDKEPAGGTDVTIEDCYVHGYSQNLSLQGMSNLVIRRCVIADATSYSSELPPKVGLYVGLSRNVLIEENLFDHNGWPKAGLYHHNVYIQSDVEGSIIFRRNIVVDAPSHGIQMRPGGTVQDNLFVRNAISIQFGSADPVPPITGCVIDNVILEGTDTDPTNQDLWRGVGILCENVGPEGVLVRENILANKISLGEGGAIECSGRLPVLSATVRANIVHNWSNSLVSTDWRFQGSISFLYNTVQFTSDNGALGNFFSTDSFAFSQNRYFRGSGLWFWRSETPLSFDDWRTAVEPTAVLGPAVFQHPERSLATYAVSIGTGNSQESLLAGLRAQSRTAWNPQLSIDALLTYFRNGFRE